MSKSFEVTKGTLKNAAHAVPNMTPMVDVVMCILIFFMLGSSFLAPEMFLPSALPATRGNGPVDVVAMPAVRLTVNLERRDGVTWFSASDVAMVIEQTGAKQNLKLAEFLAGKKQSMSDDVQVIITPRQGVPYQDVITVYDKCVNARFKQVAFAPVG